MQEEYFPPSVFSMEDAANLAKTYGVRESRINELQFDLDRCAWSYEERKRLTREVDTTQVRRDLAAIAAKSFEIASLLDGLSELAKSEMERVITDEYGEDFHHLRWDQHYAGADEPDPNELFLKTAVLRRQLKLLEEGASKLGNGLLDPVTKGPNRNRALEGLVLNLHVLWHNAVDRPFTRDDYKGAASSEAAQFCVEVCARIDPAIEERTVLNAMKKHITTVRGSRGWQS